MMFSFFKKTNKDSTANAAEVEAQALFALKHDIDVIGEYIHYFPDVKDDALIQCNTIRRAISELEELFSRK